LVFLIAGLSFFAEETVIRCDQTPERRTLNHNFGRNPPREESPPRLVAPSLAALCGRICRSLMECGFNSPDELLRLNCLKRTTVPQTAFEQRISLLSLRLSPAEITGTLEFDSDEQTLKLYCEFIEKDCGNSGRRVRLRLQLRQNVRLSSPGRMRRCTTVHLSN
jgi:hypothetical protein